MSDKDVNMVNVALDDLIQKKGKEGKIYRHRRYFRRRRYNTEKKTEPGKDNRRRLKVENLNKEMQFSGLSELFGKYGNLTRCGLHYDKEGKSIGVADIEYSTHEEAEEAIKKLNDADIEGVKIKVAYASTKFRFFRRNRNRNNYRRRFVNYTNRNRNRNRRFDGGRMRYRRDGIGGRRYSRRNRMQGGGMGAQSRNGRPGHRRLVLRSLGRRLRRNKN